MQVCCHSLPRKQHFPLHSIRLYYMKSKDSQGFRQIDAF